MSKIINGTCRDCANWTPWSASLAADWAGQCGHVAMRQSEPYSGVPAQRDGVVFYDLNHGGAALEFGPDFGCIHWRGKS